MDTYDIIGDVHGHAFELISLLNRLGYIYQESTSSYVHPEGRKLLFLGDYIDRGPQSYYVYKTVRSMVESGSAIALMGNHEFNFVCYHTLDVEQGVYLRPNNTKNHKQIAETLKNLKQYINEDYDALNEMLDWFRQLPLWFENEQFRAVHACWDTAIIERLKADFGRNVIPAQHWKSCSKSKGYTGAYFEAIEVILKGRELKIPKGGSFKDKDGHKRTNFRVKWWESVANKSIEEAAVKPSDFKGDPILQEFLNEPITFEPYPATAKPVFVGHYWLDAQKDGIALRASNVACLDYSIAKGGSLVAYRMNTARLNAEAFVVFSPTDFKT